jgi:hypothetical protein
LVEPRRISPSWTGMSSSLTARGFGACELVILLELICGISLQCYC